MCNCIAHIVIKLVIYNEITLVGLDIYGNDKKWSGGQRTCEIGQKFSLSNISAGIIISIRYKRATIYDIIEKTDKLK